LTLQRRPPDPSMFCFGCFCSAALALFQHFLVLTCQFHGCLVDSIASNPQGCHLVPAITCFSDGNVHFTSIFPTPSLPVFWFFYFVIGHFLRFFTATLDDNVCLIDGAHVDSYALLTSCFSAAAMIPLYFLPNYCFITPAIGPSSTATRPVYDNCLVLVTHGNFGPFMLYRGFLFHGIRSFLDFLPASSALLLVSWLKAGESLLFWFDLLSRFRSMVPALISSTPSSAGEGIFPGRTFCQVDCFSIPFSQLFPISSLDFL
jgi:hypothetical protein